MSAANSVPSRRRCRRWWPHSRRAGAPRWLLAAAIPAYLMYGGNWEDALGPLSERMIHYGVLGLGNLLIIALAVALHLRSHLSAPHVSNPA